MWRSKCPRRIVEKDYKDTLSTYKITPNIQMIAKYVAVGPGAECQRSGRAG